MRTLMSLTLVVMISAVNMYAVMRVKGTLYKYYIFFDEYNYQNLFDCLENNETESCIIETSWEPKHNDKYQVTRITNERSQKEYPDIGNTAFECGFLYKVFSSIKCSRMKIITPENKCESLFVFIMRWETNEYFHHDSLYNCSLGSKLFGYSLKTSSSTLSSEVTLALNTKEKDLLELNSSHSTSQPTDTTPWAFSTFEPVLTTDQSSETIASTADSIHYTKNNSHNEDRSLKLKIQLDTTSITLIIIGLVIALGLLFGFLFFRLLKRKQTKSASTDEDNLGQHDIVLENVYSFSSTNSDYHSPTIEELMQDDYVPIDTTHSEAASSLQRNVSLLDTHSENEQIDETVTQQHCLQGVYSKLNENIKLMTNVYGYLLPKSKSNDTSLQINVEILEVEPSEEAKSPTDITISQTFPNTDRVFSNYNKAQVGNNYEIVSGSDSTLKPHDKILPLDKCASTCNTVTGVDVDQDIIDGTIYVN